MAPASPARDRTSPDEYQVALHGRLLSLARPAPGLDPMAFLRAVQGQERFLWRDGRTGTVWAGVGVAAHLMGYGEARFTAIQRQVQALFSQGVVLTGEDPLARPRLFGGFSFREDFTPDVTWTAFHPAHFILPHFQLACQDDRAWLTVNVLLPPEERPMANLPLLREALDERYAQLREAVAGVPQASAGETRARVDYPLPLEEWARLIHLAQAQFRSTPLQKVVLSRICQLHGEAPFPTDQALARLERRYPGCFVFLFEPLPGHAFLGATPELLVQVQGDRVVTMALAGSSPRGPTPEADGALARALLASVKDRHEHALVVASIRRRLAPFTRTLTVPSVPQVLALSNIQHLHTPIEGTLKEAAGVLPLVQELHPTPALGGTPRELALAFIQEHEPTLRGWYAGPVGWVDPDLDGTFAVAIRSAVVQGRRAWLYAGSGIVADSVAEREWEETEWKFRPMLEALAPGSLDPKDRPVPCQDHDDAQSESILR